MLTLQNVFVNKLPLNILFSQNIVTNFSNVITELLILWFIINSPKYTLFVTDCGVKLKFISPY